MQSASPQQPTSLELSNIIFVSETGPIDRSARGSPLIHILRSYKEQSAHREMIKNGQPDTQTVSAQLSSYLEYKT